MKFRNRARRGKGEGTVEAESDQVGGTAAGGNRGQT